MQLACQQCMGLPKHTQLVLLKEQCTPKATTALWQELSSDIHQVHAPQHRRLHDLMQCSAVQLLLGIFCSELWLPLLLPV